jgi:hypothetical protein
MCFSAKSSIVSFFIGIIGSILCISLGSTSDKIVGYYLGFVALMQGIEYLLWRHQKCDNYNRFVSILGMILNHLQPFVLGLIILFFNQYLIHKKLILFILGFYLLIIIPYSIQFLFNKKSHCTIKNTENHLSWKWNSMNYNSFIYFIFILTMCSLFILGFPTLKYGMYSSFLAILTYFTSAIFYSNHDTGALWCYYVVFLPFLYYLYRIFI